MAATCSPRQRTKKRWLLHIHHNMLTQRQRKNKKMATTTHSLSNQTKTKSDEQTKKTRTIEMRFMRSPSRDSQHKTLTGQLTEEATQRSTTAAQWGEEQIRSNPWAQLLQQQARKMSTENNDRVHWPCREPDVACAWTTHCSTLPALGGLKVRWCSVNDTDFGSMWKTLQQAHLSNAVRSFNTFHPCHIGPKKAFLLNSSFWLDCIVCTSSPWSLR